jgi:carboxymethylenebutenolidase
MAETITLTSVRDGFEFQALHAHAEGERKGGVVVVQEIFGLDRYVQEDVARWASKGFEAIAPSMFDRQKPGFVAGHDPEGMQEGIKYAMANGAENPVSDIQACINALKDKGPVFIVGYCYGGAMSWRAAAECTDLSAASSYYGQIAAMAGMTLTCPVICHFGRKDGHIPADEVKAAILAAHPQAPVYIYENSGHGFNNDGRPDSDPEDAELARARTLALFEANGAR